jgi:hypothetical protein
LAGVTSGVPPGQNTPGGTPSFALSLPFSPQTLKGARDVGLPFRRGFEPPASGSTATLPRG